MGEFLRSIPEDVRSKIYLMVTAVFLLVAAFVVIAWALGQVDGNVLITLLGLLTGGGVAGMARANT